MPSPPPTCWSELAGRSVGVWGLGVDGRAVVRKLESLGIRPVLVDDNPVPMPGLSIATTSQGGLGLLEACDVVIKSPGISRYRPEALDLAERGVLVVGGLGLWLEEADRDRVVLITGTKGKSTTASVLGHLLERLGHRCFVGGNLGVPPYDPDAPDDVEWWIIETSSYQATDLWSSSPVTAVTSLSPDHLDWHGGSTDHYFNDKLALCSRPGADLTVANGDDPLLRERRPLLGPRVRWVTRDDSGPNGWVGRLGLLGVHNRVNALIAGACLEAMGIEKATDPAALADAAAGFRALPSRLQVLGRVGGVDFVDDSLSTNVLPTIAALSVFPDRPVALLAGGFDRGIDYAPLAQYLRQRSAPTLVLALPDSGPRIRQVIEATALPPHLRVEDVADVHQAALTGAAWARPAGVVLLSPAAPSFGRFNNYRERAADFLRAMVDYRADRASNRA